MMAYTSFAGTMRTAARITCSSRGFPPTSCNTLGSCDLSLVPLPAAMMATARRGAASSPESPRAKEDVLFWKDSAREEELPFDFFIGLNIPRLRNNGYFPSHRLKSLAGRHRRGESATPPITEGKTCP